MLSNDSHNFSLYNVQGRVLQTETNSSDGKKIDHFFS